jgi:photosystem II stability/assembly factor-like uncharacterized protein
MQTGEIPVSALRMKKYSNLTLSHVTKALSSVLIATVMYASPVQALEDVLDSPAIMSKKAASSLLLDVTLAGDRLIAVGERGHIIYSDDSGITWTQASVPASSTLTSVYFVDDQTGWAVGHDAIVLRTDDAGVTWSKQFDGFEANRKVVSQAKLRKVNMQATLQSAERTNNDDKIAEAEEELENVMFSLDDAQFDLDSGTTKPLLDLWFKNKQEGFVIGAYGFMFRTTDGGKNWSDWSARINNPDRFHLNSITHAGFNNLIMVGEAGLVFRSRDGGLSWDSIVSPYEGSLFGLLSTKGNSVILTFGLRGNLFRSIDQGDTWLAVNSDTQQSLIGAAALSNGDIVVTGSAGVFVNSNNTGRSFNSKILSSRDANAAISEAPNGNLILVGEGGIKLIAPNGADINALTTVK